jgi:hypothetical protein
MTTPDPRYPIGRLRLTGALTPAEREAAFAAMAALPTQLAEAVRGLTEAQLDTPYRPGGWSLRQVVHHLADSHVHAYCRHKLTLSEDVPTIQSYDENAWARFADAHAPIGGSLLLIQQVHARLVECLRAQPEEAFARRCRHTTDGEKSLDDLVATYAWHGRHHVAHITTLRAASGW